MQISHYQIHFQKIEFRLAKTKSRITDRILKTEHVHSSATPHVIIIVCLFKFD